MSQGNRWYFILYKGYIEANLIIQGLPRYDKDVLFLVVLDHKYGEHVSVQLSTLVIDDLVVTFTKEQLQ